MRKTLAPVLCCLSLGYAASVNNPTLRPSFANLQWYSDKNTVKSVMGSRNYAFIPNMADTKAPDLAFAGFLSGRPAIIKQYFNDKNQLVRSTVIFSINSNLYSTYLNVKDAITQKYGLGKEVKTGNLETQNNTLLSQAILSKNSAIKTVWLFSSNNYVIVLDIINSFLDEDDVRVRLSYESPGWSAELDRRNINSDF